MPIIGNKIAGKKRTKPAMATAIVRLIASFFFENNIAPQQPHNAFCPSDNIGFGNNESH
jgi:hypothetical protein